MRHEGRVEPTSISVSGPGLSAYPASPGKHGFMYTIAFPKRSRRIFLNVGALNVQDISRGAPAGYSLDIPMTKLK
jgi:hypothetical protein